MSRLDEVDYWLLLFPQGYTYLGVIFEKIQITV